jgi:hypothetical protein
VCPQCKIAGLYVKNEKKERLLVYVSDEGEVVPRNLEENMEGFDLTIVYCLGFTYEGILHQAEVSYDDKIYDHLCYYLEKNNLK